MAEKPLSLRKDLFSRRLTELVNKSELPAFIVNDILRNILLEADQQAQRELEADIRTYNAVLAAEEEKSAAEKAVKQEAEEEGKGNA